MYYYLISSLKRRLILELQNGFAKHPVYNKIVPFIENKYSFEERPNYGIVVKGSSANKVQLSGDNYLGIIQSHVMLAHVGAPSYMLEWVREDTKKVDSNQGVFPTEPGIYYLECLSAPTNPEEAGYFAIDRLLTVTDFPLLVFQSGIEKEAQLDNIPVEGTLRIWENRNYELREGSDYTVDYQTGAIRFLTRSYPGSIVTAEYRYAGESTGPHAFYWNQADFNTLPGVILAFGKRAVKGDKVAIVIYQDRVDTATAFGGKFEVSFDLDVISQDPIQMEEIADFSIMHLWGQRKSSLEFEGIEILDINMGGETEETYDETGQTFYYLASLGIQFRTDWELHVPLPFTISNVAVSSSGESDSKPTGLVTLASGGLLMNTLPYTPGRNYSYERIS